MIANENTDKDQYHQRKKKGLHNPDTYRGVKFSLNVIKKLSRKKFVSNTPRAIKPMSALRTKME